MSTDSPIGDELARVRHVILDRDGVLNRELERGWLTDPSQWEWEEGALDALAAWASHGVLLSVVTNQSGIGRGAVAKRDVDKLRVTRAI